MGYMKVLLLIGILVCILLVYIIYKNSKGVDALNNFYNVIENYSDIHNNMNGASLDDLDTRKMAEPTNQYSTMNKQTASLAQGDDEFSRPDKPEDELSQEERNKIRAYLTESDRRAEPNVNDKLEDRINDPGGFFDGNVQARSFLEVEKVGLADEPAFRKGEPKGDVDFNKEEEDELMKGKMKGDKEREGE